MRYRTFTICTGDMDSRESEVRITEIRVEPACIIKVIPVSSLTNTVIGRQLAEKEIQGFSISHNSFR